MQLYLIRHAQSANNDLYIRTGSSDGRSADPALTELGHLQARLLADYLVTSSSESIESKSIGEEFINRHNRRGFDLTHLYCSLMTRAIQTGSTIASATGLPITGWMEIHERGGIHHVDEITGEDTGLPGPNRRWFEAEFPHLNLPDSLGEAGWWDRPPETVEEAHTRATIVWTQLLERHGNSDDRVALVSHLGFFQSLLTVMFTTERVLTAGAFGISHMQFGMSNASISRFDIAGGSFAIRYLNRVHHLPDELITG